MCCPGFIFSNTLPCLLEWMILCRVVADSFFCLKIRAKLSPDLILYLDQELVVSLLAKVLGLLKWVLAEDVFVFFLLERGLRFNADSSDDWGSGILIRSELGGSAANCGAGIVALAYLKYSALISNKNVPPSTYRT